MGTEIHGFPLEIIYTFTDIHGGDVIIVILELGRFFKTGYSIRSGIMMNLVTVQEQEVENLPCAAGFPNVFPYCFFHVF